MYLVFVVLLSFFKTNWEEENTRENNLNASIDKKSFQSNANHQLADSLRFIVNKFDNVGWGGLCTES